MEKPDNQKFSIEYTEFTDKQLKSVINAEPPISINIDINKPNKAERILASKIEVIANCPDFKKKGEIILNINGKYVLTENVTNYEIAIHKDLSSPQETFDRFMGIYATLKRCYGTGIAHNI